MATSPPVEASSKDAPEPSGEPSIEPSPVPSVSAEPSVAPRPEPSVASSPGAETADLPPESIEPIASVDTDDYVVTFAPGTSASARTRLLVAAGADVVDLIAPLRIAVIRVRDGSSVVAALRGEDGVNRVELDRVRATDAEPSDRHYRDQWSLTRIGWDHVYGGGEPSGSAIVAVLDTGVDARHPDLSGQLVPGTSLLAGSAPTADPNGHGTAMAGIIAAATDNGVGIAGIGFSGVKVMPVTVLDARGLGQDSDIIEGIVWAVDHGADVINLSFSNPGYSTALQAAVDYAWDRDVVVVAATGNDGSSAPTYPAGDRGVVGVSNTDRSDALSGSSNYGAATFLGAPGTDITTLASGGGVTSVSGTSASSAEVSAAAALLRTLDPGASNGVIVGRLARSAADVGTRAQTGNGRLDLGRAAADTGSHGVKPVGAAPSGVGGPFVGPYVAAVATVDATTTLNGSTGSITVSQGVAITMLMSVTTTGSGTANDWDSSRWAFASSAPAAGAMTCVDHADHNGPGTFGETIVVTAPVAVGTYDLYLYAYNVSDCVTGQSVQFARIGALNVVADTIAPTATVDLRTASDSGVSTSDDVTNAASLVFDVNFSETVTGLAAGDFSNVGSATGCAVGAPAGSGAAYNVTLSGCSVGTVILRLGAGAVSDPAGNANAQTDGPTVTVDRTAPSVTINQAVGQADPTNASPIAFTVVFSEPVSGFVTGDVTVGGTSGGPKTGTVSGGPATYAVAVTGMTTSGTVVASIAASRATDTAGNNNTASTATDNSVTWDVLGPTVTINQAVGQPDPTGTSPINFTIVFNEAVSGFATGDVTVGGTSGGTKTGTVSGGPTTYTVAVTGMTTPGTVVASIAAGVATDTAGNANAASTSTDNTVTWDNIAPTATVDLRTASDSGISNSDDVTNVASPVFDVNFSETVTSVTLADFSTTGSTATGCTIGSPTGSGAIRSVTLTGCSSGSVVLNFAANGATDTAGNTGPAVAASLTVTVDRTAPSVTINQAVGQADPTNASPIAFTVVFSEAVSGFVTGDVTVGGTSGGPKTGTVSGGPATYAVAVTGMTTSGTVVASIAASRATDTAGNNNTASTATDNSVTWDVLGPTVTINQAVGQPDPTGTSPINFTIVFNEAVSGFATGDVTVGGTSGGTKTGTVSGGPTTYTVAVTGMTTPGTVVASIAAGVATDTAGNANAASTSTDNTVTWDNIAPTATVDLRTASDSGISNSDDVTNVASPVFDVNFSETVTSVTLADFSTTGSTATGCTIGSPTGSGAIRSVTLTGCSSGSVVLNFAANGATDTAGNTGPAVAASLTVTVDRTAPSVTINQAVGQADPTNASPIAFTVVFSEAVSGFVTGDVTVGGTSGGTKTGTVSGGPATYAVAVTGMTTSGTVVASIAASRATDTAGNNNTASTATDNSVTWDRATHLGFVQQPTDTVYGSTISPAVTVAVLDASDQVVTESGVSVRLTLAPSGPALGGTVMVAVVNGIATFGDLTVDAVGSYTLAAATPGLTGATSTVFDITPAALTITADDRTKTYGQTVTFAGTEFSTAGLLNADTVDSVTMASPGAVASATVAGSPYPITPSAAVGSGLANYTISYVEGALTVTPAALTITADDRTKTYGQTVTFAGTEFSTAGLLNADTVDSVTMASPGAVASATVAGSPYPITPSAAVGSGLANYTISYVEGALTVTPAALTITADDRTKTYGQTVTFAGTEFSTAGLLNADTVDSVTMASPGAVASATVAGSPYPITPSAAVGSGLANYTISYVEGELTVTPAALTITADDRTKTYGQTVTFAGTEFSTAGLLNADTVDSVTMASPGAVATAAPGVYPIAISTAIGSGLGNYTINYVEGELTVDNTTPVIGGAHVTTAATTTVSGAVTVSDPDPGQTVTLSIAIAPADGVATVAADGSFTYTPTGTFTGHDTFTIRGCDDYAPPACGTGAVTIAIHPVALDDIQVTTEGKSVEVDVQANDIGDAGALQIVSGPAHGTAVIGSIIYTPTGGFTGTDHVVYRICSPNDDALCDDGTLTITVVTGEAPETDTEVVSTPIGPVPAGMPLAIVLLLSIGAVCCAIAVTERRRRPRVPRN